MHAFGPEMGGGVLALNFTEFVVVNVQEVFSTHVTHKDSTWSASSKLAVIFPL